MGRHDAPDPSVSYAVTPGRRTRAADDHGIEMRDQTDTTGEVRDRASDEYDREHGDNWWAQFIAMLNKRGDVNSQVQSETSQDAQTLAQGVTTRTAPGISTTNYKTFEHESLQSMVKDNVNPGMSMQMSDAWIKLGNEMVEHQGDFAQAIGKSESEWRGTAGNNARQFMADVANYIGKAGQSAQLAGKQESLHSLALSSAGNSMPDPIPFDADAANADLRNTTDPFTLMTKYATYSAQYQASESAHDEAAQVVSTYDKSLSGASTMPAFDKPPQMTGGEPPKPPEKKEINKNGTDKNGTDKNGNNNIDNSVDQNVTNGNNEETHNQQTFIPGNPDHNGNGHDNGGNQNGGNQNDGHTTLPGTGGVNNGTGGINNGTGGVNNGTGGQSFTSSTGGSNNLSGGGFNNNGGGFNNPGGMPIPMNGGFNGGIDESRGGSRFGGPGGGGSGFGAGAGAGAGGAGGRGPGGFGPGGNAGVGGLAAEQAAMGRGGASGAAGRGGAGMGGMGAGRGEGGEDEEHTRASYLVEPDPDSTFGTDEMTAPPVIGG
jgi:hypothetical protein